MKRHFACNACGRCCHGPLPLSIEDALANSELFPLFIRWTAVLPESKSYGVTCQIGLEVELDDGQKAALRVTPLSYVPSNLPCPSMTQDGLCEMQDDKPLRCQMMPFDAALAEDDQDELMIPKPGWNCNITEGAPLVYQDDAIVEWDVFAVERERLEKDAEILAPFAQAVLDGNPDVRQAVFAMAQDAEDGEVITPFADFMAQVPQLDAADFAAKQRELMEFFTELTADNPDQVKEHGHYANSAQIYANMFVDA